jgi:hypothetical protein
VLRKPERNINMFDDIVNVAIKPPERKAKRLYSYSMLINQLSEGKITRKEYNERRADLEKYESHQKKLIAQRKKQKKLKTQKRKKETSYTRERPKKGKLKDDYGIYVTDKEKLDNFNKWYKKQQYKTSRRNKKPIGSKQYIALKQVWEESGSPLIYRKAHSKEFGEKYPGRAHFKSKSPILGRTKFGADAIYNINNYDDLFAELAHSAAYNKGILGRYMMNVKHNLQYDDPSRERREEGDRGMYDRKWIDIPFTDKYDIWTEETKAHGRGEKYQSAGKVGRESKIKQRYKEILYA